MQAARDLYQDLPIGSGGHTANVLDALTRRMWVREKDLAKELKIGAKQLLPVLLFLQEEKLIQRQTLVQLKRRKREAKAGIVIKEEKIDPNSYCGMDYIQVYDAVRFRIHAMTNNLKKELNVQNTVQQYICTNCDIRFSSLEAQCLASLNDDYFHCEKCNKVLEAVDENNEIKRKRLLESLGKVKEELKLLSSLLEKMKGMDAPKSIALKQWLDAVTNENDDDVSVTPVESSSSVTIPDLGTALKPLPDWMIKEEGLKLSKEQIKTITASVRDVVTEDEGKQDTCAGQEGDTNVEARLASTFEKSVSSELSIKRLVGVKSKRDEGTSRNMRYGCGFPVVCRSVSPPRGTHPSVPMRNPKTVPSLPFQEPVDTVYESTHATLVRGRSGR
ncbi:hypothetical protein EJB05_00920, partial [Eragrostis curvula]